MLPKPPLKGSDEFVHVGRGSSVVVLVSLVVTVIAGCETSSTVSSGPSPVKCAVSLAAVPMMEPGGGNGVLEVTTQPECAWDATTSVGWISALSPATGQGTANVAFRVAANDGAAAREGTIVVNGQQARVAQRAPCRYNLGPATQTVAATGGKATMTIATASECSWEAVSEVSWITVTSSTAGSGNATVEFAVGLNDGAQRTGAISVGAQRVLITQLSSGGLPPPPGPPSPSPTPPPNPCTFSLTPGSDFVPANEGSGSVRVTASLASCAWTATSNDRWVLISSGATGTGNGTVTYRFTANTAGSRTATLTIAGLTFTVIQGAGQTVNVEQNTSR